MKNKKVAILQSNYIPWKGYFDLINSVDEFIIYDTAQYTKNDWRNRNKIKTPNDLLWLTIPVSIKSLNQKIFETTIAKNNWNVKHYKTIQQYYRKAKYYKEYIEFFEDLYLTCNYNSLSEINHKFILAFNSLLGIKTKISWSSDYELIDGKSERLLHLCKQTDANIYLSGPAAKGYLDESIFSDESIKIEWMDYSGYKEYNQLNLPFEHGVSLIDLIFNEGPNATKFMNSF